MTNHKPEIRASKATDFEEYYGEKLSCSIKGLTAVINDKIVGMAGIAYHKAGMMAFSKLDDEMKKYPVLIMKTAVRFRQLCSNTKGSIYAIACPKEKTAKNFLSRIGFVYICTNEDGDLYKWLKA